MACCTAECNSALSEIVDTAIAHTAKLCPTHTCAGDNECSGNTNGTSYHSTSGSRRHHWWRWITWSCDTRSTGRQSTLIDGEAWLCFPPFEVPFDELIDMQVFPAKSDFTPYQRWAPLCLIWILKMTFKGTRYNKYHNICLPDIADKMHVHPHGAMYENICPPSK